MEKKPIDFKPLNYWEKSTDEVEKEVHQQASEESPDVWANDPTAISLRSLEEEERALGAIRTKAAEEKARQERLLRDQEKADSLASKIKSFFGSK
ncbi:MAG: hypothetical protein HYT94_01830 [Parcubacteria group bacterium]|nr:hypothetical protein [Parcubacteria group bacterium]